MTDKQAERLIQSIDRLTSIIGLGISAGLAIAPTTWSNDKALQAQATAAFASVAKKIEEKLTSI